MDTSKLKKFASFARISLIEQVGNRLKTVLAEQSLARRESAAAVAELEKKIKELGKERVVEMVAYTWFNRFCALRFMDVNGYTTIGTVSPAEGFTQPEILTEAKQGVIDEELKVDRAKIIGLLDGTRPSQDAQGEVYQQLLIAVCNSYHKLMPFMFEKIADYTELLIPEDLLSDSSVLAHIRNAITLEDTSDSSNPKSKIENRESDSPKSKIENPKLEVEVIGWLYQFYISEKKDEVFAALKKGKKITPENIPAATQLFTPHWIVRYLVENSLGRLWMLNHPDSKLVERMDYYIKPEEPETDFLRISSPEEIKVCDPACGSGHMLTYAFDLLYSIYEEQGYQATDIPRLILKHNLYGVEIDQRAGALAAFALVMKARQKDRRFFSRKPLDEDSAETIQNPKSQIQNPNVCVLENISIDPEDLSAYMDKVGRDLFSGGLQGVVNQWEEADNFGSLIRPLVTDVSDVLELLRERQMGQDLFLADVHQKVLKALRQADYLSPKYQVVVANPPYMGRKGMNAKLIELGNREYSRSKTDVYAMFVERIVEQVVRGGLLGVMTPFTWMFLSSFSDFRAMLIRECTLMTLVRPEYHAFFDSAFVPICAYVFRNQHQPHYTATFIDLSEFYGADLQAPKTREAITSPCCSWRHDLDVSSFERIPETPITYWFSDRMLALFHEFSLLKDNACIKSGLSTGDNDRFLRFWHEVDAAAINKTTDSPIGGSRDAKWVPYNKGGAFRKWYGNQDLILNWGIAGEVLEESGGAVFRNRSTYFRAGVTWGGLTSSDVAFRWQDSGSVFDSNKGAMVFATEDSDGHGLLGLLNSKVAAGILRGLNPTLSTQIGDIERVPFLNCAPTSRIVKYLVEIATEDWNSVETAREFSSLPLLRGECSSLHESWSRTLEASEQVLKTMLELEAENNRLHIEAFGLSEELTPEVSPSEITLVCNMRHRYDSNKSESELESLFLADTMREFISYAVGCLFGRYSLDKPGLILANQGDTFQDYLRIIAEHQNADADNPKSKIQNPKFLPDEDNVIPLLDGDWFTDDITERFKAFLKVTFGTEHFEENLKFLEDALYPDNLNAKKRKTIRDYFLKDFYNHHIKLYKKRPIYWLFSSPKGTFNALIYMHRYRPDTVGTVLHYLRDFRDKLTHHADHQQMLADSGSASKSEKTQAIKDVAAIKKQLKELEDYEKTLFEVAARKIDIDLDDGVKHNYQLFGPVLRKIPGLEISDS